MTAATPAPVAPAVVPGKTLGIVALIVSFFFSVLGIILGIVAKVQSNRAGVKNTPATVAIVLGIIFFILTIVLYTTVFAALLNACNGMEPGQYTLENGGTLTCG